MDGTWYHADEGLWYNNAGSLMWWNSANALTALCDTMALDGSQKSQHVAVVDQIYNNAAAHNPHFRKVRSLDGTISTSVSPASPAEVRHRKRQHAKRSSDLSKREPQDFTNSYYDDEGWWALGWLDAYDLTGDIHYLNTAIDIWNDMKGGASSQCPGGIWWDKKHTYVNAIANELYISVSAGIAVRVGDNVRQTYLDAATSGWNWFKGTGMIGSDNLVVDGLTSDCKPTGDKFTYNQGVILGGLVDLNKLTGDGSYLDSASNIANAVTASGSSLTDANGILHEGCDRNESCDDNGAQFKGVFVRNLRKLQLARGNDAWKSFLQNNARSLWEKDLQDDNGAITLGENWAGPFATTGATSQISALDALNAALAVS